MVETLFSGWLELLSRQPYDCFFTITFKTPARSGDAAIWRARIFLTRYFEGRHEHVRAFIVAEPHESGFYHVHGLLDSHGSFALRKSLWEKCFHKHGRCRFEPVRSSVGVQGYVVKYLLKSNPTWEILGAVSTRQKQV